MTAKVDTLAMERRATGYTYRGEALRCVAMPLGGIGAGQVSLCGDGGLRQWQIVNQANHLGFIPDSFFAIRASSVEPPLDVVRILQSREVMDLPEESTPLVNDNVIPQEQREFLARFPGVEATTFTGAYPFARIAYADPDLPLDVSLEAWSPFIPLDADDSGLPAVILTFRIQNRHAAPVHGCMGATLQNAVGWDGVTPIVGNRCPLYGGNVNRLRCREGMASIVMDNPSLADDHPGAGQMVLAALTPLARPQERWTTAEQFLQFMEGFHLGQQIQDPSVQVSGFSYAHQRPHGNSPSLPAGPSPDGETWNSGLLVPYKLDPGEDVQITFVTAWHFPNRYVNFDQFGPPRTYGKSRFWLGNAYAERFADATDVADYVAEHRDRLEEASRIWSDGLFNSSIPAWAAEALAAQGATLRSPTCFWTADRKFFGFEGSLGASTTMWNGMYGGSCPLNCTHVWNYEQALSRLFPHLEQTMRETDFEITQAPEGYIPHRTYLPLYLPQLWDVFIGGPDDPALDGMLGTVLKVYREVRQGAGRAWLHRLWPAIKRLLAYVIDQWDPDGDGVLTGKQPNTYDISFYGPNMFIGGLWLAALRAGEEIAFLERDAEFSSQLRGLFDQGSRAYDAALWNGEYYIQMLGPQDPSDFQYGEGCLSDQLLGQWWAHLLDLGYILPQDHIRTALRSIVRYNFRTSFQGFRHDYRVFADCDDAGLLVCTWPRGGRPDVPLRYADEVWTGSEYQVGAHLIMEGLVEDGWAITAALRSRYSGRRRNPYNEIECGDHYARSLAGWSLLDALSGLRYSALDAALRLDPANAHREFRGPFVCGTGWGEFRHSGSDPLSSLALSCSFGEIPLQSVTVPDASGEHIEARLHGELYPTQVQQGGGAATVMFQKRITLRRGDRLVLEHAAPQRS